MEHAYKNVAIIGAGASGSVCAYYLLKNGIDVTIFDFSQPLRTLLPTGGGRCNFAHAEYDFKELAKNYPRGEKFLYSVFSKFSTYDTLALFEEFGIEAYTQENGRIFPVSNSSKDVKEKIWDKIKQANFYKEKVINIEPLENEIKVKTDKAQYLFSDVAVSVGGHWGYDLIKNLDIKIVEPKPSLVGLKTEEKFGELSGIVIPNVCSKELEITDDLLFTHFGISGPLIYKISSINARKDFPYKIELDLYPQNIDLQEVLNNNPHKEIKNILSEFLPKNFVKYLLAGVVPEDTKSHRIDGKTRDLILDRIHKFELTIKGADKGEETVTAGGVDLNEINPKTMESKKYPHIYFTGEVLDIDGFCGGFNLQNAWSTAYVASKALLS